MPFADRVHAPGEDGVGGHEVYDGLPEAALLSRFLHVPCHVGHMVEVLAGRKHQQAFAVQVLGDGVAHLIAAVLYAPGPAAAR